MAVFLQSGIAGQPHLRRIILKSLVFVANLAVLIAPLQAANSEEVTAWPRHQIAASVGILKINISGAAGSGTVLPPYPGAEFPNLRAPDQVDTTGGRIDYVFNSGNSLPAWMDPKGRSSNLTFTASWSSYTGNETATGFTPSGSDEVGLLFTKFRAPPAPTGYFPGAAGLESHARTEVDYGRLDFGIKWLQLSNRIPGKTRLIPKLQLSWTQFDYRVITTDTFDPAVVPPVNYRDERDQQMQQDIFELQIGSRLERMFGGHSQFSVYGDVGLNMYFLKAYLSSFDYVTLDGDTRLRWVGEGKREAFIGIDLGLGLAWKMSSRWSTALSAKYSPWVPTAIIINPTSAEFGGAQTYADTARESHATFLLGVAYGF